MHIPTAPLHPYTAGGAGALKPFIIISISYLLFTVTDGAVRMLVLLHAYNKGFTAMVGHGGGAKARPWLEKRNLLVFSNFPAK